MPSATRSLDEGKSLAAFGNKVHVACARCAEPGVVHAEWGEHGWTAHFECLQCSLQLNSTRGDWVGPVRLDGRRPCGYCGHKWLKPSDRLNSWPRPVVDKVELECPECKRFTVVSVRMLPVGAWSEPIDPHFGQPLALVDSGRHGALWAYNLEHLEELRRFVAASLRERTSEAGNGSMLSTLPVWLKSAKNRASILKRIHRLAR
jgi:hypothetical protein